MKDHLPGRRKVDAKAATALGPVEVYPVRPLVAVVDFVNSSKTTLAERTRTILPPVTFEEGAIKIHRVASPVARRS